MLKKIESLRQQPKSVRDRYAFFTALGVTFLIAAVWAVSLPSRYASIAEVTSELPKSEEVGNFARVFGDIKSQLQASIASVKNTPVPGNEESEAEETTVSANSAYEIDIAGMFTATSTTNTSTSTGSSPTPKVILIATTTDRSASSTAQ